MRRRRRRPRNIWIVLVIATLVFQAWKEVRRQQDPAVPEVRSGKAAKVFEVLLGARLQEDRNNDGDSFKVLHQGRVHELRLYFADCPEKRRHFQNGKRLEEQGQYFGGLSEERTLAIGRQAELFTRDWLTSRPFTVYTKWQGVFDSGRHYAFVVFPDGEDLSVKLVRQGLARIHTTGVQLPDGRSASQYQQELRQAEQEARAARLGGWAR